MMAAPTAFAHGPAPQLLLAPMEGLLDFVLRDVLTRVGGYDRCVSEFIRVTDQLLPARVFVRVMPELMNASRTAAGVPVRGQLLGSDPACMADNAARLAELGSHGVDLNFGCPAKVVNRHGGGAFLLQDPEQLQRIVEAVRRAVPAATMVSAKMRLGYEHDRHAELCAQAIEAGGAGELVVHARTKAHGYRPPAYWERVADVRAAVRVPVVANGEVWSVDDARRCLRQSGAHALMLGRGAVVDPALAGKLRHALRWPAAANGSLGPIELQWSEMLEHLEWFWLRVRERIDPRAQAGRLKQWLNFLRRQSTQAEEAYQQLRCVTNPSGISQWLALHRTLPAKIVAHEWRGS